MQKKNLILLFFMPLFAVCAGHAQPSVKLLHLAGGNYEIHPIPGANPALRHFIDLQVPTGIGIERTGDSLKCWFASSGHTNATVGYAMVTGWKIEQYVVHDKTNQYLATMVLPGDGSKLDVSTNSAILFGTIAQQFKENNFFEERATFFESDVQIDGVWSAEWGHYKVLWAQTFREPIE